MTLAPVLAGRRFEMNETFIIGQISKSDELASFIRERRQKLTGCYERLADEMAMIGETKLEAIYRSLAEDAERLSTSEMKTERGTPKRGTAYVPVPANADLPDVAGLSTPYTIWAFAVSNEVHLFEELAAANISISDSKLQSALALEARACLDRADGYRIQRRLAFHAERLSSEIASFPDIRRIDTIEDFAHVALAIEHYFQSLLSGYDGQPEELASVIETTGEAISYLDPVARSGGASNRLTRPLKRLANATSNQSGNSIRATYGVAKIAIEADRIFDYYDQIFESTLDLEVTRASQYLSAVILERLRTLRTLLDTEAANGKVQS